MNGGQIARQPGKQQIEAVIVGRETEGESPNSSLPQQVGERRALGCAGAIFRLGFAAGDELALGVCEELVVTGIAIESVKEREKKNADYAGHGEIPAPSEMQQHETQYRNPDG